MPWKPKDAKRHTKKAKSAKRKRQWAHVADSVLERTGDEGAAVRAANSVVKKTVQKRKIAAHGLKHKKKAKKAQRKRTITKR
jgi:hypothetical protein